MTHIDLHTLANLHGFGKAKDVLRSTGHWDEHAADGAEPRRYEVYVSADFTGQKVLTVSARSIQEAKEKAEALSRDLSASEWDMDLIDVRAETVLQSGGQS